MGDCQLWSSAPYPSPAATADPPGRLEALIVLMPGCDDPAAEFPPPPGSGPDRGSLPPSVQVTRLDRREHPNNYRKPSPVAGACEAEGGPIVAAEAPNFST